MMKLQAFTLSTIMFSLLTILTFPGLGQELHPMVWKDPNLEIRTDLSKITIYSYGVSTPTATKSPSPTFTPTFTPTATFSPTATPIPRDVNRDGIVDCDDVFAVMGVWHLPALCDCAVRSDISGDGYVDKDDLLLLAGQWQKEMKHTPTPTLTFTPTATLTFTVTHTPTFTYTPTGTFTPTFTPTRTYTPTPTNTPKEHPLRGRYDVWITGDDTGTGQIRIYDNGSLDGEIDSDALQTSLDVSGTVDRQGNLDAIFLYKGTKVGTAWGRIETNGIGGGYWENVWDEEGDWIAVKIQD